MIIKPIFSKVWSSCPKELADIRRNIASICQQQHYSESETNDIVLAIDEACTNIIRYGYNHCTKGTIRIEVQTDPNNLIFKLFDEAEKVSKDCIQVSPSSLLKPGGLGVILIHQVMDSVKFIHTDQCLGNILELKKTRPKEEK